MKARGGNSGQVLVVAALIIALTIISTELYVYELGRTVGEAKANPINEYVLAIKLGSQHIVTGSLANVSQGGSSQTLTVNLERWASLVYRQYHLGRSILNFTPYETEPYSSGINCLWGSDGLGVSSAYVDFTLKILDQEVNVNVTYAVNVTTTILIQGTYKVIQDDEKQVNVTCNLLNEGKPALAKGIILTYRSSDDWLIPGPQNGYTFVDYGNGTYSISFAAEISSDNVEVSVNAYDQRDIYTQANVTCVELLI
jgi:hypothetical protein